MPEPLRYEDAAFPVTVKNIDGEVIDNGWMSARTRVFYSGRQSGAEHHARYTDATDFPCECGGRRGRHYTICDDCRSKAAAERWAKNLAENGVDWDGETPVCVGDDQFFFDEGSLASHLDDYLADGGKLEDLRVELCKPATRPDFEMEGFLCDVLPDDDHGGHSLDTREIDKTVNDWIEAQGVLSWWASGIPVCPASLAHLVTPEEPTPA